MENVHYVGLDAHKKTITFCIKLGDGTIVSQGKVPTDKKELASWPNFTGLISIFLYISVGYLKLLPIYGHYFYYISVFLCLSGSLLIPRAE